jgi:APA family basic amino acid/polyamine antiporter
MAQLMSNPRVMYAMSEDKILPTAFQKRNRKDALSLALSVFAGLAAIIVFGQKNLIPCLAFPFSWICFGMVLQQEVFLLSRKRTAHLNGTGIYSMKWFPLLPLIFIAGLFSCSDQLIGE